MISFLSVYLLALCFAETVFFSSACLHWFGASVPHRGDLCVQDLYMLSVSLHEDGNTCTHVGMSWCICACRYDINMVLLFIMCFTLIGNTLH